MGLIRLKNYYSLDDLNIAEENTSSQHLLRNMVLKNRKRNPFMCEIRVLLCVKSFCGVCTAPDISMLNLGIIVLNTITEYDYSFLQDNICFMFLKSVL